MKFKIQSTLNSSRLGIISDIARLPGFELETPHVFLYTKGGTVPHLSHYVLQKVSTQNHGLHLPLSDMDHIQERMKLFGKTLADFIGMKEYITYLTYINPGEKRISGFHESNNIPISTRNGIKKYSATQYMTLVEDLKPDMFAIIADGDTDSSSSQKRINKSFNKSVTVFEKSMEFLNNSETLKTCQMLGSVEGGYNLNLREQSSKIIGESSVFGVVIDGLHDYSENVSEISFKDIKLIIESSLKHIPKDKLRIIHGCWNPKVLLSLIEIGIDIFDSSYPYLISEKSGALVFPNNMNALEKFLKEKKINLETSQEINKHITTKDSSSEPEKSEEQARKKIKLNPKSVYYKSLSDSCYITDFTPLVKDCLCYTCQKHTKAYIHHLFKAEEMLGFTLLMIHNTHHYLDFLSNIRLSLRNGTFQEMKQIFELWSDKNDSISIC